VQRIKREHCHAQTVLRGHPSQTPPRRKLRRAQGQWSRRSPMPQRATVPAVALNKSIGKVLQRQQHPERKPSLWPSKCPRCHPSLSLPRRFPRQQTLPSRVLHRNQPSHSPAGARNSPWEGRSRPGWRAKAQQRERSAPAFPITLRQPLFALNRTANAPDLSRIAQRRWRRAKAQQRERFRPESPAALRQPVFALKLPANAPDLSRIARHRWRRAKAQQRERLPPVSPAIPRLPVFALKRTANAQESSRAIQHKAMRRMEPRRLLKMMLRSQPRTAR